MGGSLAALFLYPVKSCRGIALTRWDLERRGLRYDRRWMVVDETGTFVTQRTEPRLAQVEVALEDSVVLRSPIGRPLHLPIATGAGAPRRPVRVWKDTVDAVDCGPDAARWMSEWLEGPVSLVFMPDEVVRPVKPAYARPGDQVGFADGFPLLIASTASMDDLNRRILLGVGAPEAPLPIERFRPNLVVTGFAAWAEDDWERIRIGELQVRIAKPCERCVITTTDQKTGARGIEPLPTLATFRRARLTEGAVLFAQNAVPESEGSVAVGDPVTVLETRRAAD